MRKIRIGTGRWVGAFVGGSYTPWLAREGYL